MDTLRNYKIRFKESEDNTPDNLYNLIERNSIAIICFQFTEKGVEPDLTEFSDGHYGIVHGTIWDLVRDELSFAISEPYRPYIAPSSKNPIIMPFKYLDERWIDRTEDGFNTIYDHWMVEIPLKQ